MKKSITIRIDEDVLEWFKSKGKGYQSKMNDALRNHFNMKTGKGYLDVEEYYKDQSGASGSEDGFIDDPEIDEANRLAEATIDPYFKPMPKKGKVKK